MDLKELIEHEYFVICPLLSTNRFISYCRERRVETSRRQLERLEKLRIFFPVARILSPKLKIKIEYVNNGKAYNELGELRDDEKWNGDIMEQYAQFCFDRECALDWLQEGFLWDPRERVFQEWSSYYTDDGESGMESFYSQFQCYTLNSIINIFRIRLNSESLFGCKEEDFAATNKQIVEHAEKIVALIAEKGPRGALAPTICQVISNRYFPSTQSDGRTIRISPHNYEGDWDWYEYCREWNAESVRTALGISNEELKNIHETLVVDACHVDPLERWYSLVSFVSVDMREKLKGSALLARSIYAMEHMIRLFYRDLSGEKLNPPDESPGWTKDHYYGAGIPNNQLKYLQYLTNQYHLNPKPNLILVVEGAGELEQFPRVSSEMFGLSFPQCGIEIMSLDGIGNFTGDKALDKYGTLVQFVDYHHYNQTIVFIILDDEGRARKTRDKLVTRKSNLFPDRMVTKSEYVMLWDNTSIEFANFSDDEIAFAMMRVAGRPHSFKCSDISRCRVETAKKRRNALGELYKRTTGHILSKRRLLEELFDELISGAKNGTYGQEHSNRPIIELMERVIGLAIRNYQPSRLFIWEENQRSGVFGDYPAKVNEGSIPEACAEKERTERNGK